MNQTCIVRIVCYVVGFLALGATTGCREKTSAKLPPPPVPVHVSRAEQTTLHPVFDLVGTIVAIPEHLASVSPQAGGWIKAVAVTEGQDVKVGQTLIDLDPRLAEVNRDKAHAALAEKRAALKLLENGYLPQEIEMARAALAEATANADTLEERSEERRVGKECRSRWSPYH